MLMMQKGLYRHGRKAIGVLAVSLLVACTVNPVTGQRNLGLISEREEIQMGVQYYGPMQQSEGGTFKVDPTLSSYVNEVGQRVAAVSDRDLPYEFVVLNNPVPNAWALPGGKIAINRGLLTELSNEAELAAVLGHEVVHSAARHGAQAMERGLLMQGALMATAIAASSSEYAGFLVGGAAVGAQLVTQRYGRDAEREADYYGTRYMALAGYDPQAAVGLQEAFVRLSNAQEPGWLQGLFSSHPPSMERVRNNQQLAQQLYAEGFTDGELGEARYRQALAFLTENREAYAAFDEANDLLRRNQPDAAAARLDTAIRLLPQEARFHGLKGDILLSRSRYDEAIDTYNQAIGLDDSFFAYFLGRGLAYSRQGNRGRAEGDLQASVNLLPTAQAMNELGNLSLAANNRDQAKRYFQQAAAAPGSIGEQAATAFARLDMSDNPGNYLRLQPSVGEQGQLRIALRNDAPVGMASARLLVQATVDGRRVSRRVDVPSLASGQSRTVDTGLNLPPGTDPAAVNLNVQVESIRVN
jgi:predicted Zn-dependent protease